MILGTIRRISRPILPLTPSINSTPLEVVNSYKYLGVNLNSQLNFNEHIQQTIGLAASKINTLPYLKMLITVHC